MKPTRHHSHFSQLFVEKKLPGGATIFIPYVADLSDEQLQEAFEYWLDREDYEYMQHLSAEASHRGIALKM